MYGDLDIYIGKELQDLEILGHQNYIILSVEGDDTFPIINKLINAEQRSLKFDSQNELLGLISELCRLGQYHKDDSQASPLIFGLIDCVVKAMNRSDTLELFWD